MQAIEYFSQKFNTLPKSMQIKIVHYAEFLQQKQKENKDKHDTNQSAIDELNTGNLETLTPEQFKQQVKEILA